MYVSMYDNANEFLYRGASVMKGINNNNKHLKPLGYKWILEKVGLSATKLWIVIVNTQQDVFFWFCLLHLNTHILNTEACLLSAANFGLVLDT